MSCGRPACPPVSASASTTWASSRARVPRPRACGILGVTMKTIGVLGGISPQATMDFEARVHRVSQRLIPQDRNYGYPPMVVWYHRRLPMKVGDDGRPPEPRGID